MKPLKLGKTKREIPPIISANINPEILSSNMFWILPEKKLSSKDLNRIFPNRHMFREKRSRKIFLEKALTFTRTPKLRAITNKIKAFKLRVKLEVKASPT